MNQLKKVPNTDRMDHHLHRGGDHPLHRGDHHLHRGGGETTTEDENSDKESLKEEKENQVKYQSSYLVISHHILQYLTISYDIFPYLTISYHIL